jgi:SH3-like domain-containing protein
MHRLASALLASSFLIFSQAACAGFDYVTSGRPAILYDAPSTAANKTAVIGAGYPLEVLVRVDNWLKVRDRTGDLLWIQSSDAHGKPSVIVTSPVTNILEKPQSDAPTRYRVSQGVTLEVSEDSGEPGWIKVRHPQGGEGYLSLRDIWGQ